jgi:predicted ABC-type ATPase
LQGQTVLAKPHLLKGESFAFETTLSGRGYARMIPEWQAVGYRVKLIFLSLPSVGMSIDRVATRVAQGGHNVPENIIKRRFLSGLNNFHETYKPLVDVWALYDNSQNAPILLEKGGK